MASLGNDGREGDTPANLRPPLNPEEVLRGIVRDVLAEMLPQSSVASVPATSAATSPSFSAPKPSATSTPQSGPSSSSLTWTRIILILSLLIVPLLCIVAVAPDNHWYSTLSDHVQNLSVSCERALKEALNMSRTPESPVQNYHEDCCQVFRAYKMRGSTPKTGVFDISDVCQTTSSFSQTLSPMKARCDMESNNGGWTVLIRQVANAKQEDFTRTWAEYENGFGDLNGEFFYGLKNMHCLTTQQEMEVEIEHSNKNGEKEISAYGKFAVHSPSTNYRLEVSGHLRGGTYLSYHNGMVFTTKDRDNDNLKNDNCANVYRGGWWHVECYHTTLTDTQAPAIWREGKAVTFDNAELRARPTSCIRKHWNCEDKLAAFPSACRS